LRYAGNGRDTQSLDAHDRNLIELIMRAGEILVSRTGVSAERATAFFAPAAQFWT
jgi:hypothetical protein